MKENSPRIGNQCGFIDVRELSDRKMISKLVISLCHTETQFVMFFRVHPS